MSNRETWLHAAIERMRPWFEELGIELPPVKVSVSFPATGWKGRAIGECHYAASDGVPQLLVHPSIVEPHEVLAIVLHELVHAALGPGKGHGPEFRRLATSLGLTGKMTATVASEELEWSLRRLGKGLGAFPHASLVGGRAGGRKTQSTRMIKVMCSENPICPTLEDGGYTIRTTRKWLDLYGAPKCPRCDERMMEA